jgi:hypothetical protein
VFDAYLQILREVDEKARAALFHDSRQLNECPACFYQLEDEPKLEFSFLCSIDGNNSLRRMSGTMRNTMTRIDSRVIKSDRFITPEEVDRFKDEVQSSVSVYCFYVSPTVDLDQEI